MAALVFFLFTISLLYQIRKELFIYSLLFKVAQGKQYLDLFSTRNYIYHQAFEVLKTRFGREQDVVQSHLEAMLSAPPPTLFSPASMEQFCSVVNSTVTVLHKLEYVGDLGEL